MTVKKPGRRYVEVTEEKRQPKRGDKDDYVPKKEQ